MAPPPLHDQLDIVIPTIRALVFLEEWWAPGRGGPRGRGWGGVLGGRQPRQHGAAMCRQRSRAVGLPAAGQRGDRVFRSRAPAAGPARPPGRAHPAPGGCLAAMPAAGNAGAPVVPASAAPPAQPPPPPPAGRRAPSFPCRRPFFQPYHLIIVQDGDPTKKIEVPEGEPAGRQQPGPCCVAVGCSWRLAGERAAAPCARVPHGRLPACRSFFCSALHVASSAREPAVVMWHEAAGACTPHAASVRVAPNRLCRLLLHARTHAPLPPAPPA